MKIHFVDLRRQYQRLKEPILRTLQQNMQEASFIMGPAVAELEKRLAHFTGVQHAIGCGSGTEALMLALMAEDVQPDDEIITTPFSFFATAEVIALLKARPVFADIDPETFNLNPANIEPLITPKTKGIIAVDLFGQCADHDSINAIAQKNNLFVIEDAAQSFGATYKKRPAGSLAKIGCTSFFPAKPFGCYGDGGMLFTNDAELAATIQSLRNHGMGQNKYDHINLGLNARLDTLQAAVLLEKLAVYPEEIQARQQAAVYYARHLGSAVLKPHIPSYNTSVWAQFSVRVKQRTTLREALQQKGIPTAVHYPKPLHLQPALAYLGYQCNDFPIAEQLCTDILSLPLHPYLTRTEQDFIIETVNSFYEKG